MPMNTQPSKLKLTYGDCTLGVSGSGFQYLFSYDKNGLESLRVHGKEWLYRVPAPTFWRASTDNDRGCGFPTRAAQWLGADLFSQVTEKSISIDGGKWHLPLAPATNAYTGDEVATTVAVRFVTTTATTPSTTVTTTYTVQPDGRIVVAVDYAGQAGLPELPVFGLRLIMLTAASEFTYTGLSGETYPDRMAGGRAGTYHIDGLPVTPYLVPQDCGVHMNTTTVTITRTTTLNNADKDSSPFSLGVVAHSAPFAFSCLPYTAEELESATHQNELPPARRTVLTVMGAVRGVGGIDSWGSDVTSGTTIPSDQDIHFDFELLPQI